MGSLSHSQQDDAGFPADAAAACITVGKTAILASNDSLYNHSRDFVEVRCLTQLIFRRGRCYCRLPESQFYQWYPLLVCLLAVVCVSSVGGYILHIRRDQRRRDARQQQTLDKVTERDRSIQLAVSRIPTCAYAPTTHMSVLPGDSSQAATPDDGEYGNDECPVCLCSLVAGDQLRELPCSHKFHAACIDRWLIGRERRQSGAPSCPLCKQEVLTAEDMAQELPAAAMAEVGQAPLRPWRWAVWAVPLTRVPHAPPPAFVSAESRL